MCVTCGKAPAIERRYCDSCSARVLARRRKGCRCQVCGMATPGRRRRCDEHPFDGKAYRARKRAERVVSKACIDCGRPTDGTQLCLACRERARTSARESYRRLRLKVIALYGGACTCCGETESDFLTLDHINNDGAVQRRQQHRVAAGSAFYKRVLRERPTDVQVHCYNCNCAKGHYGICPHKRAEIGEARGTRIRRVG